MSTPIAAIHWKKGPVAGLRCFADSSSAINGGENPATLVPVSGILVKWPGALGTPPSDADVATWITEYDASLATKEQRRSDVKSTAEADNFVDKLRDATSSQITQFVQNNVTDLTSAKVFLGKLAIAVAYSLQGGKDK